MPRKLEPEVEPPKLEPVDEPPKLEPEPDEVVPKDEDEAWPLGTMPVEGAPYESWADTE